MPGCGRRQAGAAGDAGASRTRPPVARCAASRRRRRARRARFRRAGAEAALSWAPDSQRLAYYAVREGVGSVWVAAVEPPRPQGDEEPQPRARPSAPPQLVSRRGGAPAWSPDGSTILVTGLPDPQPVYNGNPERSEAEAPPLFAASAAFQLWRVPAPRPVHESGGEVAADLPVTPAMLTVDVRSGMGHAARALLRRRRRPGRLEPARATPSARGQWARSRWPNSKRSSTRWSPQQPLIKPVVTSNGGMVVSGHPLASEAGRQAFEKGGNVVDAMIAVSFALGVVEPEASRHRWRWRGGPVPERACPGRRWSRTRT